MNHRDRMERKRISQMKEYLLAYRVKKTEIMKFDSDQEFERWGKKYTKYLLHYWGVQRRLASTLKRVMNK